MRDALESDIARALEGLGPGFGADVPARLATLLTELERWNRRMNLTAIRAPCDMITGHLLDSLVALPFIEGGRILDIGTGAGFPGLPLAVALPERSFTLLDSNARKIRFVEHAARQAGLSNVLAVHGRAEAYAPAERFTTVIARAVAPLSTLIEIAGHHVGEDGVFVALKGRRPAHELHDLPGTWQYMIEPLSVPGLEAGARHAVILRRNEGAQRPALTGPGA